MQKAAESPTKGAVTVADASGKRAKYGLLHVWQSKYNIYQNRRAHYANDDYQLDNVAFDLSGTGQSEKKPDHGQQEVSLRGRRQKHAEGDHDPKKNILEIQVTPPQNNDKPDDSIS